MSDRGEGPRFVVDPSGNVRDVSSSGHAPSQPPPDEPPGNGRERRSRSGSPRKSGAAPYFIPIPIGLITWLVIALVRGCGSGPGDRAPVPRPIDSSDLRRGTRAYFQGDYDTAIMYFTVALRSYTPVSEVYNRRGLAYDAKGEYENALQDYGQALSHDPTLAMVHNNRAATYFAMDDLDHAMADLDRAIELEPALGKAYHNRGLVQYSKGDYDAAIADLSQALQYPASATPSLFSEALARMPTSEFSKGLEAEEMEQELAETGADAPSALYWRALAYQAKGDPDSALADLDRAIDLLTERLPETTPVARGRGPTPSGEATAAPEEEGGPRDPRVDLPSVYYQRAIVYMEKAEYDQAAADLERVLELADDEETRGRAEIALAVFELATPGAPVTWFTATPPPAATSTPGQVQPSHETPGTPTPLNAHLSCDEKPLSMWGPAGTYRYRITGGGSSAELVVERGTGKQDSREYYYFCDPTSDSALFSAHCGESLSAPPKAGESTEFLCQPRAAVIGGGGTVSIQVVGLETKTTELGTFQTIRVDTRMKYSFTTGLHDTFERVDEKKEWYACGYGLVLSTVSVAESKYGMELKPRSGTVTLISFTPILDW